MELSFSCISYSVTHSILLLLLIGCIGRCIDDGSDGGSDGGNNEDQYCFDQVGNSHATSGNSLAKKKRVLQYKKNT